MTTLQQDPPVQAGPNLHSVDAVANYFLSLAEKNGQNLTHLKLQKLVYFAQGSCLAIHDRPLFAEPIQAWTYGPVIQPLYEQFREFGGDPIPTGRRATALDYVNGKLISVEPTLNGDRIAEDLLQEIWKVFGPLDAIDLSNLSHQRGTPWAQIKAEHPEELPRWTEIPEAMIKEYFRSIPEPGASNG